MSEEGNDNGPFHQVLLQGIDVSANVRRISVEDNDRLIDEAVIVLDDPKRLASEAPREGNTLLIKMGWANAHAVLFEGEVIDVSGSSSDCGKREVTIKALDLSYRIRKRSFQATNHAGKLSDVVRAIVERDPGIGVGVGQIEPDPDPEFTEEEPLRQTTENDWNFIIAQANRHQCRAFVEYNDERSQFYFVPISRLMQAEPLGVLSGEGMAGRVLNIQYQRIASSAAPRQSSTTTDPDSGETVAVAAPEATEEPPQTPDPETLEDAASSGAPLDAAMAVTEEATETPDTQRPESFVAGQPSDPARAAQDASQDPTMSLGLRVRGRCVGTVMLRAKGSVEIRNVVGWANGRRWHVRKAKHLLKLDERHSSEPVYITEFELTR